MCGIFFYLGKNGITSEDRINLENLSKKLIHRGPDEYKSKYYNTNVMCGFHRLAIVGTDSFDNTDDMKIGKVSGMQPFETRRYVCMVNGEIYNYVKLKEFLITKKQIINYQTSSDCEVLVYVFEYLSNFYDDLESVKRLCQLIDGEYCFVIYDKKTGECYYATDELSVRPLFIGTNDQGYYLVSEQKAIIEVCDTIVRVKGGEYGEFNPLRSTLHSNKYHFSLNNIPITKQPNAHLILRDLLIKNVETKLHPDREFGFLLSGGLDSSLICSIAAKLLHPIKIKTFTVGFSKDATDVIAADKVAKHIGSDHTTFICDYSEGIDIIPDIIYSNESWDQTTTRASIVMSLCVKKMREKHSDMAVIFSGEVADELLKGYLYNLKAPSLEEGRLDQISRLENIHTSDGLRADRTCSAYSFELRLPFFSREILEFVLSLEPSLTDPKSNDNIEKYILRKAFDPEHNDGYEYLPNNILWRKKHAFSDSTSVNSGWKDELIKFCDTQVSDSRFSKRKELYPYCTPQTKEDMHYREVFNKWNYEPTTVPYKWMSSWCDPSSTDSSASVIDVFEETIIRGG